MNESAIWTQWLSDLHLLHCNADFFLQGAGPMPTFDNFTGSGPHEHLAMC